MAQTKQERNERQRAYRLANREKILAREAAHREQNREKIAAYNAAYNERNREKNAARAAAYREQNREKIAARQAAWSEQNREKILARQAAYYKKNRKQQSAYHRARNTGFSPELFAALIAHQQHSCAICAAPLTKPNADHCHFTGRPRGVLCWRCNTGIGHFNDSILLLEAAIAYLREPPAEKVAA
jgi:hypothetical protein